MSLSSSSSSSYFLFFLLGLDLVISIVSTCVWYSELYAFEDSPIFVTQLNMALAVVVPSLYLLAETLALRWDDHRVDYFQFLRQGQGGILQLVKTVIQLAILNSAMNFLQIIGVQILGSGNSNLAVIIQQTVIPLSAFLCIFVLKTRFSLIEFAGIATVLGGVGVAFGLRLHTNSVSQLGAILLFCSCIPTAGLNIMIEKLVLPFRDADDDDAEYEVLTDSASEHKIQNAVNLPPPHQRPKKTLNHRRALSVLRKILIIVILENAVGIVLNVPLSVALQGIKGDRIDALWDADMTRGLQCLFASSRENCKFAYIYVILFAPLGVLFVVMQLLVTVYGGSTLMFLMIALSLPIQNFFLASKTIMGSKAGTFYDSEVYGLVIILMGLLAFIYGTHRKKQAVIEQGSERPDL